eukprot:7999021-Pyramimonas_sp.AAC.2
MVSGFMQRQEWIVVIGDSWMRDVARVSPALPSCRIAYAACEGFQCRSLDGEKPLYYRVGLMIRFRSVDADVTHFERGGMLHTCFVANCPSVIAPTQ